MSKVLVFPLLKKKEFSLDTRQDIPPTDDELSDLSDHYISQMIKHLENHGFPLTPTFLTDMAVAAEFIKSGLYRSVGKYHTLQDTVDELEQEIHIDVQMELEKSDEEDLPPVGDT